MLIAKLQHNFLLFNCSISYGFEIKYLFSTKTQDDGRNSENSKVFRAIKEVHVVGTTLMVQNLPNVALFPMVF